ncbi:DUF3429 domain-containing protein [Falsiroseomonas oryziterrae]|uniref:DUF3429 domain-containing protein n=1 Tax=Falsiroseomonas oryziterrae TaxID=2911368 RepID=UPI001F3CCD78|nr:DUF3429 domain-containing protein [Roseomonas sp. NPKOSM-4]
MQTDTRADPPAPARILGPAGLIPFAALALGVWLGWPGAAFGLTAYGATILAFLGAVHWGLALAAPAAERSADWPRLGLGVVPALVAWIALLLPPSLGLGILALGILATAGVETLAARRELVPGGYLRLRWLLSAGAAGCLLAGLAAI